MDIQHTPMSKVIEKGYDIGIEYEHTITTKQYENYKPKLTATVPIEDLNGMLGIMRRVLSLEETKIKNTGGE
jgi:hypothetical protein